MKKGCIVILFCFISISSVFSQLQKQDSMFILKGQIENVKSGVLKLYYINRFSKLIRDTANITNEHFEFQGYINEPTRADLIGEEDSLRTTIILSPCQMKAFIPKENFNDITLIGSKTQEEFNKLKLYRSNFDFIKSEPSSYVSLNILYDYLYSRKYDSDMLDSLNVMFNLLDTTVQNSKYGKEIKWELDKRGENQVDSFATDFLEQDINGDTIRLSDFRGKNVVLLDFWASWCRPCRAAFPFIKDIYEKYHPLGLEIIAISVDFNKDAWINAINKDSITNWHHIWQDDPKDLQQGQVFGTLSTIRKNSIRDNYDHNGGRGVPFYVLIDKDGKVVWKWLGESEEMKKEIIQKLNDVL